MTKITINEYNALPENVRGINKDGKKTMELMETYSIAHLTEGRHFKIIEDEYEMQALDFLKDTQTRLTIACVGKTLPEWDKDNLHSTYDVTLTNKKGEYIFKFYDSIANTNNKIIPTEYDTLTCLQTADIGTFTNFCEEFEYNEDSRNILNLYLRIQAQYTELCKLFTDEEIEQLQQIQ